MILIAHPEQRGLGCRFRLAPGTSLEIGRSDAAGIGFPEVSSLSRNHARICYSESGLMVEDLRSTNGTWVNDRHVSGCAELRTGDRLQVGGLHFKVLLETDVENAYHALVYDLMIRDGLTRAINKERFEEDARREVTRALRYQRPCTLVLFDVDHFKSINDSWGHLFGDRVLRALASLVTGLLRSEQSLARVGGEEFAILCPETTIGGAHALAERLREAIARLRLRRSETDVAVTCSFGVADLHETTMHFEDLYEAADRALYASKAQGRNRVTMAGR